jgi:hypothetical protein
MYSNVCSIRWLPLRRARKTQCARVSWRRSVSCTRVARPRTIYRIIAGRLAMSDAVDLLKAEVHDEAEVESIRIELETLFGELTKIGIERGQRLLTGEQAKIATD